MDAEQYARQNVFQNLGQVFYALKEKGFDNSEFERISSRYEDPEAAAKNAGWREAGFSEAGDHDEISFVKNNGETSCADDWDALCREQLIELEFFQAYEYHLVSWNLGQQLIKHGQLVSEDLLGMIVWARYEVGQAVWRDSVIKKISAEQA